MPELGVCSAHRNTPLDFYIMNVIYIPTFKRHDKQIFFDNLPDRLKSKVIFVVQKQEEHLFKDKNILVVDDDIGIAKTREIIYKTAGDERYLVVDDDVIVQRRNAKYFSKPSNMEGSKRKLTDDDWTELENRLNKCHDEGHILCGFKHGTILPRFNQPIFYNGGIFCIFSIDGKQFSKIIDSIDLCYVPISEDVHLNLELLSRGYPNAIMEEFCIHQISNKEGGCKTFRTQQLEDKCFKKLHKKFPKWVKIYETKSNYRNLFAPTFKTRVYYSRAYKDFVNKSEGKLPV